MPLYELINPSDPFTFEAPDILVAGVAVALLSTGFGARCIDGSSDDQTPVLFGWSEWLASYGVDDAWVESHRLQLADAFDSFLIGGGAERNDLQRAMELMTPEAREQFKADRNERHRTSMNNIGRAAYARAKRLRELAAVPA